VHYGHECPLSTFLLFPQEEREGALSDSKNSKMGCGSSAAAAPVKQVTVEKPLETGAVPLGPATARPTTPSAQAPAPDGDQEPFSRGATGPFEKTKEVMGAPSRHPAPEHHCGSSLCFPRRMLRRQTQFSFEDHAHNQTDLACAPCSWCHLYQSQSPVRDTSRPTSSKYWTGPVLTTPTTSDLRSSSSTPAALSPQSTALDAGTRDNHSFCDAIRGPIINDLLI